MKTTAVYFSATETSMRSVMYIAGVMAERIEVINTTPKTFDASRIREFGPEELVVIGAPVYGGRVFIGAAERFQCLKGNNTPCVVTVTYGNRHYDDALLELADQMKSQGFAVIAAAALIGQHTFGEIQVGRPNAADAKEDEDFARRVKAKLEAGDLSPVEVPGNRPYKEGGTGGRFRPLTDETCNGCGICVEECPMGAIAYDSRTISDACISCFRCIRICPSHSKHMREANYMAFAETFSQRLADRRENEYFI